MSRLLSGIRVVESSALLNGSTTGMLLADLGADVVKIESPFLGDYLRIRETYQLHIQTNKNKRSLALDLRKPAAKEVLERLVRGCDVFVTNAPGRRNDKLGIGYEQLREIKPDIVYCQNTGFGASGPYGSLPTHGQMMDALAGALPAEMGEDGLTRRSTKRAGRTGSMQMGGEGTAAGAVYAALHIAAALVQRNNTGEGAYIDISSAEAVIASAWVAVATAENSFDDVREQRERADRRRVARYQWYETGDHRFVLFCPEEFKFWSKFCELVDRPDLVERVAGIDLRHEVQAIFHQRTLAEWMDVAVEHGLPIGPSYEEVDELLADPHLRSREIFVRGNDPLRGEVTYVGLPAIVPGQPFEVSRHAPSLGEHTAEVLAELGFDSGEVARLAADEVTTSSTFRDDHILGDVAAADIDVSGT
jgi:crotonobetainyl-CoA:carnitine CoA-transferase CaiB-like acyl-CoA transferase